jgi:hypothetical protein
VNPPKEERFPQYCGRQASVGLAYLIEGILLVVLGATAWSLIARNSTNRFDASACWLELQKMWKDKRSALAPFCKFSAIYTVIAVHSACWILVGRVNMPMRFDIGRPVPSALNYLPMSDAFDLTCQTQFDGLAPEKGGITRVSRPIGSANGR